MSMEKVAKLAGVSISTVSRVINERPRVAHSTIESVRRAMAQIHFTPQVRRAPAAPRTRNAQRAAVAFLVLGQRDEPMTPGFEKLLRGVSDGAAKHNLRMHFHFVNSPDEIPATVAQNQVDGLLLGGELPQGAMFERLRHLPTVWLMANRQRPTFGDQVMPDNESIGAMASDYLIDRGHKNLAYFSAAPTWAMEIRAHSFNRCARERGVSEVRVMTCPQPNLGDPGLNLRAMVQGLVDQLLALSPRPTGLFVAEDRLMPSVDAALSQRNLRMGHDIDVISCNHEMPYLMGLSVMPASIDIRLESIGRRGIEQLLWRVRNPSAVERVRCMVEPMLLAPEAATSGKTTAQPAAVSPTPQH